MSSYAIIGATYHQEALSVFNEGLEGDRIATINDAIEQAMSLLQEELKGTYLPELARIAERVGQTPVKTAAQLNHLDLEIPEQLQVSWFDDDHFFIDVMDSEEVYQLHLEVLPIHH